MDAILRQINELAATLDTMDHTMIDPVEYGELRGQVASLQLQVSEFKAKQAQMDVKIDLVLERLSEARGGWKVMLMFGGAAGSLGAWVASHVSKVWP
jgi:hypothetical protein